MGVIKFQKPDKVYMVESTETRGKFEFCPLEPGYGLTVGNALRRVLLSSLEGYAIAAVKIEGVEHEFSTIDGVIEDVTDIVLNLKKIRFKKLNENAEWDNIHLSISGKSAFTAGEINKVNNDFLVLNPEEIICSMDKKVKLDVTLTIAKGRGFVVSENHELGDFPLGTILTDSIFTPIKNVKYGVENFRVGQKTDYEKLVFEIDTDGSILPKDALTEAAKILIHHFMLFSDDRITMEDAQEDIVDEYDEESLHMRQLLKTKLVDLELSVRALNCLKAAEIDTLGELVQINKSDLMKFRNFGKKSLTELEQFIESKGLVFGMDVSAYKLDKE